MEFSTLIIGTMAGHSFNPEEVCPMAFPINFAVAGLYAISALATMTLIKKIE